MKKLILLLSFCFSILYCATAQNMLGSSGTEIRSNMADYYGDKWEYRNEESLSNNSVRLGYRHIEDPFVLLYFIMVEDVCVRFIRIMPKEKLSTMIIKLNEENYHEGENVWITKEMKTKITLEIEKDRFLVMIYDPIL
ncbi:hypothetical protein [Pontibacter pudoricolor]|uniref:hypothetical protein n=1 Tax=Pontibacter pudoricolor TaxID=2694930 RepID=UPI001390BF7D|nr:hypothetical protein [Pontibacter pudoricolor]